MKRIRLLTVGRLKTPHWRDAASYYYKRLSYTLSIEETIVKDADATLSLPERKESEGVRLLKSIRPSEELIVLDENGKTMPSEYFASFLQSLFEKSRIPCFAIGGAYGLADSVLCKARHRLAFGPMTFPHELARVLLLEQLYRAENILSGTGYHH